MKPDGLDVKRALDARLSALDADPARRARVRQRIIKEEQPVKHKMTVSVALALVAALVLTGAALAAAGVNVFAFFASTDSRLARVAPDAELATQTPLDVTSEALGVSSVRFDSAYYDGQSLLVGIAMENVSRFEPFEPGPKELAAMKPVESGLLPAPQAVGEDAAILAAFNAAVENGGPCGYVEYIVYPSDHIVTADGIDLGPAYSDEARSEDGAILELREMETPLPEAARDRDALELHMKIWRQANTWWFDGETLYKGGERSQAGEAVCTVKRSEAERLTLRGEGEYNGVPVTLTLRLSALHGELTVIADGDAFPAMPDHDTWYEVILTDGSGAELRELENAVDTDAIRASYNGTGGLPERVTVRIVVATEGDWDRDAALAAASPIELTAG